MAHILIVDDEAHIRKLLGSRLAAEGHAVTYAADGREALERIAEARPDVVFLDVMMPWLDGFEVLKKLRQDAATRELPVFMLTERAADADVFRGWWAPHEDYFTKPLKLPEVMARLDWTLRTGCGAPVVLLVSVENSLRERLAPALWAAGLRVDSASGGNLALERIVQHRPDLIVLDQEMTRKDGLAVLQRLKDDPGTAALPVVLLLEGAADAALCREWPGAPVYRLARSVRPAQLVHGVVQVVTGVDVVEFTRIEVST